MAEQKPRLWRMTFGQWEAIDADWMDPERAASPTRLAGLFVVVALALVATRYGSAGRVFDALWPRSTWSDPDTYKLWRRLWWNWVVTLSFAIPPGLYARYVLGERMDELGLRWGQLRKHAPIYLLAALIMIPVVALTAEGAGFQKTYPLYKGAGQAWSHLLAWELSYGVQFMTLEFLFRGVLLVPVARRFGAMAVAIAVLPYCLIHFGKPLPETLGSIAAGLFLGTMALRSRSYLAGIALHVGVAWSMDLLSLAYQGKLSNLLGGG
jgi:membrane protease YdiL (CAAX protease family)